MRTLLIVAVLVAGIFVAPRASAIAPLTAEQLRDICDRALEEPDSDKARLCIYYVKGFLDGAVATDGRVAENVALEISKEETFTERAIRTRVINRLRDFGPSVYAEFCVGQPDPIAEVVRHVIEELKGYDDLEGLKAQTIVYDSLRRHYPWSRNRTAVQTFDFSEVSGVDARLAMMSSCAT